ncbi:MAG: EamA family transporter [Actinobacteria bacterium HGW-Actinobacteria-2]|nr:MAG: EamA family transporter [Actinobacteria bacterium HGW-Actinobacteria-2]
MKAALTSRGVQAALLAAVLFGAATPLAKALLGEVNPWLLAGLLYAGSGVGLWVFRAVRRTPRVRLARTDRGPLVGAVISGGIVAPVLLMFGLSAMPASGAALLLNAEAVFTVGLAWLVFREPVSRRILLGMLAIVAGAVVLSVPTLVEFGSLLPTLAVLGACLAWGVDNNLTRKVSLNDTTWLAAVKGAVAGPVNLVLGFALGAQLPAPGPIGAAMAVGFVSYGVSLALFIFGMREVGTARAGAYFSIAPFVGAVLSLAFGEPLGWPLIPAGVLMAFGVWLHLTERHTHAHHHDASAHDHWHTHDIHHQHDHLDDSAPRGGHRHWHEHPEVTHDHRHFPDTHHPHRH